MKKALHAFVVALTCTTLNAQVNTYQRTYKTTGDEYAGSVIETSNGDFMTVGFSTTASNGKEDALIMRTNKFGHTLWAKTYGDTATQHFLGIIEDGATDAYYVTGFSEGRGTKTTDAIFGKIDGNGNIIWMKAYGGNGIEQTRKIIKANDGGFFLTGHTTSPLGAGLEDCYVVKTNSVGTIQWTKVFGGSGYDRARSFAKDNQGNLVIVGFTQSFGVGGKDNFIAKMDQNGTFLWSYAYGSNKVDKAQELVIDANNDIIVGGNSSMLLNISPFNFNAFVMKVDPLGVKKYCRIYQDSVECEMWTIIKGHGSDYVFVTEDNKIGALSDSTTNMSYVKVDDLTGNVNWAYKLGGTKKDKRPEVIATLDGGYFISASSASFASDTMRNIYNLKTDFLGQSGCNTYPRTFVKTDTAFVKTTINWITATDGSTAAVTWTPMTRAFPHDTLCENLITTSLMSNNKQSSFVKVYPNPSHGIYSIETEEINFSVAVYDALGKLILQSKNNRTIDLRGHQAGIYLITLTDSQGSHNLKLVLNE